MNVKDYFALGAPAVALIVLLLTCSTSVAMEAGQSIDLQSGETRDVSLDFDLRKVIIGNPEVVDIQIVDKRDIVLIGRGSGQSSVILRSSAADESRFQVFTSPDATYLKRRINQLFPGQKIKIYPNRGGVILAGSVSGAEVIEQVLRVTTQILSTPQDSAGKTVRIRKKVRRELKRGDVAVILGENQDNQAVARGKGGGGTGQSSPSIINLMSVAGPQQVLLEVKFAEVSRKSGRDLQAGIGVTGMDTRFRGAAGTSPLGISGSGNLASLGLGSLLLNFAGVGEFGNVFVNIDDFTMALQFLEEENLARILAEPRLVTQSGQEASFLAGGEYPYPVVDDNDVSVEFKEFGVGLKFTPIINSDGLITLRVAPSVTDISGFVKLDAGDQPILSTRKLESTVHLRDGQTLALAGLLKQNLGEAVKKLPFLGDIPVLGTLFRSSSFQNDKTDLLVAVTPHIVKPARENEISYPGEFIKPPNRFEFYLEGTLEGRRSAEDPSAFRSHNFYQTSLAGGGLDGAFGQAEMRP
jgi:pilus assembly protein CpaC